MSKVTGKLQSESLLQSRRSLFKSVAFWKETVFPATVLRSSSTMRAPSTLLSVKGNSDGQPRGGRHAQMAASVLVLHLVLEGARGDEFGREEGRQGKFEPTI